MPEALLAFLQIAGQMEKRKVGVRMITGSPYRIKEASKALKQRRRILNAVFIEGSGTG